MNLPRTDVARSTADATVATSHPDPCLNENPDPNSSYIPIPTTTIGPRRLASEYIANPVCSSFNPLPANNAIPYIMTTIAISPITLTASDIHDHEPVMNVAPTIVRSRTPIPKVILMLLKNFSRLGFTAVLTTGA